MLDVGSTANRAVLVSGVAEGAFPAQAVRVIAAAARAAEIEIRNFEVIFTAPLKRISE
jgi:hypothetical protein